MGRLTSESGSAPTSSDTVPLNPRVGDYCLMTAAYNEEQNIGGTIESVLAQELLPKRWVIVSDGSSDRTDEIVRSYSAKHDFISFIRMDRESGHSFTRKVAALRAADSLLKDVPSGWIGNLDADITLNPDFFERLLHRFDCDPHLGIAGGYVCELVGDSFRSRASNRKYSVAHAAQLVRRDCYDKIGGYSGSRYGGEDWHAQTSAKMFGWNAVAFPELLVRHHRRTGEADNLLRHRFRLGKLDYCFGSDPLFEIFKCLQRLPERPLIVGAAARLSGFFLCLLTRESRDFSPEFIRFLQKEQRDKMFGIFRREKAASSVIEPPPTALR
jgi:poly-beta-1,6-N-acetyl-D-glucosamine synthase